MKNIENPTHTEREWLQKENEKRAKKMKVEKMGKEEKTKPDKESREKVKENEVRSQGAERNQNVPEVEKC